MSCRRSARSLRSTRRGADDDANLSMTAAYDISPRTNRIRLCKSTCALCLAVSQIRQNLTLTGLSLARSTAIRLYLRAKRDAIRLSIAAVHRAGKRREFQWASAI